MGSSDSEGISSSFNDLASDLHILAVMLAEHNFRLAYENWCWATRAPTWKDAWKIVQMVNRPNIGLCLDTFQTAGGEWADPTTESGLREDVSRHDLEIQFRASLDELSKTIPKEKIYILQISDAYKPPKPLENRPINGLRPRGRWSHDFRPLPFGQGYLPVVDVTTAVLRTGFRGWFSTEVFDGGPDGKGIRYVFEEFAQKAEAAHRRLLESCMKIL